MRSAQTPESTAAAIRRGRIALVFLAAIAATALNEDICAEEPPPHAWYAPLKDIALGPGKVDVQFSERVRYEYLHNFSILRYGEEDDDVLLLRTRLGLDYRLDDRTHVFVEAQDARYTLNRLDVADFPGSCSYLDQADLRQAFVEIRRIGDSPLGLKAGRQILLYGDRRVFAPAEWGNVGNYWWDAVKLSLDMPSAQIDVLYGQRVLSEPYDLNFDHYPWHVGAVYARFGKGPTTFDAFYVIKHDWSGACQGESGTGDETRHTLGFLMDRPAGDGWDYGLFGAGQLGKYGRDDIRAFGAIGRVGYTFDVPWKPRLGAEISYASGDRSPADGVRGTFDGIFGAMDIPYGWMNVVSWKNLEDYAITASIQPTKSVRLSAEYHLFRLAESRDAWYWISGRPERRDPGGGAGRDLGQELDLIFRWQLGRELELLVGYSHFFAGAYLGRTGGSDEDADWFFVQFTYSF